MSKMVVAYALDKRYLPYLKVSMASIRRYNKDVEFAILTDKSFEIEGAKVYTFTPDTKMFKYRDNDRMGDGVYYKLYLPKLPYNKVLFIDCDVICQRPLKSLWAQKCSFICGTESHSYGKMQAEALGVKKYCLTSMMLMNLKALRQANFTEKCLNKLAEIKPEFHDETLINLCFNDKIKFIDKKYNYCRNRKYEQPINECDAYLLHYIGGKQKPELLKLDDFRRLDTLKPLLKGKSVAIVGNSEKILRQTLYGTRIDNHDIVIRFNKGFPSRKPEALGIRTDLLFLACTLSDEELKQFNARYTIGRSKLCQNICDFRISVSDRVSLKQVDSQASTGFIAINFALSAGAKKIDLYGFDFFRSPTYYNEPGYKTLHNGSKEEEKVLEYAECGLLEIK